tara:strand:- start:2736 stop:3140 length:405 start_codon:yes stop_codon:yes gene_type:complete
MIRNIIVYIFIYIFLTGCDTNIMTPDLTFLDIYLDDYQDSNGYYHVENNEVSYHRVKYLTTPEQRVSWGSDDTFIVDWMFNTYEEPIINYSTYSNQYGEGQQLFYLNQEAIGDTMVIVGYINENVWDYLYFIIK